MEKLIIVLVALFLFCTSNGLNSTIAPTKKALKIVQEYNTLNGSFTKADTTGAPVHTYSFDAQGRGDSAYYQAVNMDTISVSAFGPYPAYQLIAADKKYDIYGNPIFFVLLYKYSNSLDTTYYYYFVNHYWDGTTTGLF